MILPSPTNRVRFTLRHKAFSDIVIEEPIGWKNDDKEFARNKTFHGIVPKFSNSSKFIGDGAKRILLVKELYGNNADLELLKDERHPESDRWTPSYSAVFDLSTVVEEKGQVSVKFETGGIDKIRKARFSKKVEIDRITDLEGNIIPELQTKTMALDGREIFLKTDIEVKPSSNNAVFYHSSNGGSGAKGSAGFPFQIISTSHEHVHNVTSNTTFFSETENGTTGAMFFLNSDKERFLKIKLKNVKFKVNIDQQDVDNNTGGGIAITKYKDGSSYNLEDRFPLVTWPTKNALFAASGQTYTLNEDIDITLQAGESLSIGSYIWVDLHSDNGAHLGVNCTDISGIITISEKSFAEASQSEVILAHELGERLTRIITGKENAYYSEFFGRSDIGYAKDGKGAYTGFSHGFWIRQFNKSDELFKSLTTSWKDFYKSTEVPWATGIGIQYIKGKECIRHEPLSFFYQNQVTIKLGKQIGGEFKYIQVSNVKRSEAKDFVFSGTEIGSTKGGEYEEAMGLDEYNTKTTTSMPLKEGKVYKKIAPYRWDGYAEEFARRLSKMNFPTRDSKYDKDIFMDDLKKGDTDVLVQREWEDDFEQEPTGVFSPSTATKLRFSPMNNLLRHGWILAASCLNDISDYVRYTSSVANSNLVTKPIGGVERSENSDLLVKDLGRPRFIPQLVEFDFKIDFYINQAIQGSTTILGKITPNFYGLVEFMNEKGDLERGYLFSVKLNGVGKWKLLKANR